MTNPYEDLSDRARWFMENFDECGIAEICANNETAAKRAEAERDQTRETNQRLNLRCQQAEGALATFKGAVSEWEISERGTYIPLRTLTAIAKAVGREFDSARFIPHYQRVEEAEARLAAEGEYVEHSDDDGVATREGVLRKLGEPATDPLAALRVWLSTEAAHCRRNADAATVEEAAQALGGMAAGCELAVKVIDGMTAGRGLPVSGGATPEAGAGG